MPEEFEQEIQILLAICAEKKFTGLFDQFPVQVRLLFGLRIARFLEQSLFGFKLERRELADCESGSGGGTPVHH